MSETRLYGPVKAFLEAQGFTAKGEIGGCDVVAVRPGEPPMLVICEMKLGLSLELILQAVDRMAVADAVWLAVPRTRRGRDRDRRAVKLCRLVGLGLIAVGVEGVVECSRRPTLTARAATPSVGPGCCANTAAGTATPRPAARSGGRS